MTKFINLIIFCTLYILFLISACSLGNGGSSSSSQTNTGATTSSSSNSGSPHWQIVGTAGFTAGQANYVSMAIDGNGKPYVAYVDVANASNAMVKYFDGSAWTTAGGGALSTAGSRFTCIAIDKNNVPYVAYQDWANNYRITVKKLGSSTWSVVGSPGITTGTGGTAIDISIAIDTSGTPYISFSDNAQNGNATVMKFNTSSWAVVGTAGFLWARQLYFNRN